MPGFSDIYNHSNYWQTEHMKSAERLTQATMDTLDERDRQDDIWGEQNHTPMEWLPILMEEVGEASKAALEAYFNEYYLPVSLHDYRRECIHVAAVAIAMIESFDRNEGRDK